MDAVEISGSVVQDFDLTCWYLHRRRILELAGRNSIDPYLPRYNIPGSERLNELGELIAFKSVISDWLRAKKPPTLGQLLVTKTLQPNSIFTHYSNFYCRGIMKSYNAMTAGIFPVPPALAYAKLDDLEPGWKVACRFHHEHLTSSSSWSELSGQKNLFVLAMATDIGQEKTIQAIPFVIANPFPEFGQKSTLISDGWRSNFELFVDFIDNFSAVQAVPARRRKADLTPLAKIPEIAIKQAFAEIINEPSVPKDWGGEKSDLFSTSVTVGGSRISTAFAFKGPAKFAPMTMASLGKNGDQIDRLFSEPADLLILQHCHEITTPVRGAMRAYAQQAGNLRRFCLIDGYDTVRVLRAYGKCGLGNDAVQGSMDSGASDTPGLN